VSKTISSSNLNETAGFVGGLLKQSRLAWRLLRDGRVPGWVKIIPFASLLYLVFPLDLIPELVLPGLGELDDLAVLLLALKLFVDLSPAAIVREHLQNLYGMPKGTRHAAEPTAPITIDGDYRILDAPLSERRTQER
jgi:uncharacterized membrane protein YkvA (DUF1232 family)